VESPLPDLNTNKQQTTPAFALMFCGQKLTSFISKCDSTSMFIVYSQRVSRNNMHVKHVTKIEYSTQYFALQLKPLLPTTLVSPASNRCEIFYNQE